jgi:lipid-A-disaccharide synthase
MPEKIRSEGETQLSIFISAGDPSGDIAGYHLLRNLHASDKTTSFFGLGGRRMASIGQQQLVPGDQLAVLGFWEVARRFRFFQKLLAATVKQIEEHRPRAIVLIDYPGFNLRLAEKVRPLNIPIIYYVSPQIWAWGGKRIGTIKHLVDMMLLILPFEKEIYEKAGVKNQFVGHYLLDDIDADLIKAPFNPGSDLVALLPGSRPQEVEKMLPVLAASAGILAENGKWRFAVAAVEGDIDYHRFLTDTRVPIEIVRGKTRELIAESRLVLTSSGTATLETGIIGRPMVVIYRTGRLTYIIARRLVTLDKIALINITAGRKIVPELIQNDANPKKIAAKARKFLDDPVLSSEIAGELNRVTDLLGTSGAGERAAAAVREYIKC